MNKGFFSLLLTLLLLLSLGCTKTKEQVIAEVKDAVSLEHITDKDYDRYFGYQTGLGSWLDTESEYISNSEEDNSLGIEMISGLGYFPSKNRVYLDLARQTFIGGTDANLLAYVDLINGGKHYICPDPLCEHDDKSGCRYRDLGQLVFNPENEFVFYAAKATIDEFSNSLASSLYEVSTSENTIKRIFNSQDILNNADYSAIMDLYFDNGVLHFRNDFVYEKVVDGIKEIESKSFNVILNLSTNEFTAQEVQLSSGDISTCTIGAYTYEFNMNTRTIYRVNNKNGLEEPLLSFGDDYTVQRRYYDTRTEELYILICNQNVLQAGKLVEDTSDIQNVLYCISNENGCRTVEMPSSLILDFQLTNSYIYYTKYEPVNYRRPGDTRDCVDRNGNTLYRVNRNDTSTEELFFDGHDELFFGYFFVSGNYAYLDYREISDYDEFLAFRYMWSWFRVNPVEKTIKWLNLE